MLAEVRCEERFKLVLVRDQQVAIRTELTGLVEGERGPLIYVNDEWQLAYSRLAATLGAAGEAGIRVRVQEEPLQRRLLTQTLR